MELGVGCCAESDRDGMPYILVYLPGYMVRSLLACVNITSSLWFLLNSTSTVPVDVGICQENVKRVAGGIWKCKGKTCGKTEEWRGRAIASTIFIFAG